MPRRRLATFGSYDYGSELHEVAIAFRRSGRVQNASSMESLARASTMRQERLSRCLQLLDILQSRIGHDIGRLASDFGVSRRTIHRDLRLLRDAGALLSYDLGKKGYTIDSSARLAPKSLFDEELLALLLAAQVSDLLRVPEICGLVDRAVGKLLGQASAACRTEAASLLSSVERQPSRIPWPKGTEDTCRTILMAIRRQRPLRIIYHAGPKTRGPIQTKVTLHRLVVSEATWQLVGRSSWHRRIYKFDIGLIRRAEQIDEIPAIKERRIGNPAIVPRNTSCAIG